MLFTAAKIGAGKTVKYIAGTLRGMGFDKCYTMALNSDSRNDYKLRHKAGMECKKTAKVLHKDVDFKKHHARKG